MNCIRLYITKSIPSVITNKDTGQYKYLMLIRVFPQKTIRPILIPGIYSVF